MANCYASTFIKFLKKQVGTKESPMGSNKNPYAADVDKNHPNFYNGKKNGSAWCDEFYDDSMIQCFGEKEALRLLCQPKKSLGASCRYSYGYYKAKKQVGKKPKLGAQIFFGSSESTLTHTGGVVKIDSKNVYTVEGNKNNKVSECSYNLDDPKIFGYGYPAFDPEPTAEEPKKEEKPAAPATKTYKVIAEHGLNLRKSASKSGTLILAMDYGASFVVDKTENGWCHGTYKGKYVGWASKTYLK